MVYRDPIPRTTSRADWRRPSFALPPVHEAELIDPANLSENISTSEDSDTLLDESTSPSGSSSGSECKTVKATKAKGKAKGGFQYPDVNHTGWMKKRRTKLLRHEWQDQHVRLNGTQLAMHPNELPSSNALDTLNVDDYAVACSSIASNKLSAKLRALRIATSSHQPKVPDSAFEFQLVPQALHEGKAAKRIVPHGKTHHFAVKTRDERIDWMRELMLAKALKAKGEGYEVNINGVDK